MESSPVNADASASDTADEADDQAGIMASLPSFQISHRRLLRIGMIIVLTFLALKWSLVATERPVPMELKRGDVFQSGYRIDINNAGWVEWMQLERIGISTAHRIVADREAHGPFRSIDDLSRVPGIGPSTLDQIRPWLTMGHDSSNAQINVEPVQQ